MIPVCCLRHWCSSWYLRIPPLHQEFHKPLIYSRNAVSNANSELGPEIKHLTCASAYEPFTPSDSEQRLHPSYYRGCWHEVSRCFLCRYIHYIPYWQWFTLRKVSSHTWRCCIKVSLIVQYSLLLPPVGVWAVSQSQCGRSPSQAG